MGELQHRERGGGSLELGLFLATHTHPPIKHRRGYTHKNTPHISLGITDCATPFCLFDYAEHKIHMLCSPPRVTKSDDDDDDETIGNNNPPTLHKISELQKPFLVHRQRQRQRQRECVCVCGHDPCPVVVVCLTMWGMEIPSALFPPTTKTKP